VSEKTTYDELPYADYCFARTHPEHLFAVSTLCSRAAPPFATARVLELGCARGSNLLPMALDLPGGEFVGVDLSVRQIEEARARAERLKLGTVSFRAVSLTELDARDGDFDYIVCHGVYSWVDANVRDHILHLCRERLRPSGVAYVSFNTLPGWNNLRTVREFLRLHVAPGPAPKRLESARRALAVYAEAIRHERAPWAVWMRDELAWIAEADDAYVFHEYLETANDAFYLTDFVAAARAHGLAHLADANPTLAAPALRPGVGDPLALAQSVDFAENRRFRAALLVHRESAAGSADPANLARLHLASRADLAGDVSAGDLTSDAPVAFTVEEHRVELRDPWLKCALATLAEQRPRPMSYGALAAAVAARLGLDRTSTVRWAAANAPVMLDLVFDATIELRAGRARYAAEAGQLPIASPLARMQASEMDTVTTYRHGRVEVPAFERALLPLLDGTRDRSALVVAMTGRAIKGETSRDGAALAGRCEEALDWLVCNALLAPER
jgi:SAM-dependent methyltransferase